MYVCADERMQMCVFSILLVFSLKLKVHNSVRPSSRIVGTNYSFLSCLVATMVEEAANELPTLQTLEVP